MVEEVAGARLYDLERRVRRVQLQFRIALLVLLAVVLVSARQETPPPDLCVRSLTVVDDQGRSRLIILTTPVETTLSLGLGEQGAASVVLSAFVSKNAEVVCRGGTGAATARLFAVGSHNDLPTSHAGLDAKWDDKGISATVDAVGAAVNVVDGTHSAVLEGATLPAPTKRLSIGSRGAAGFAEFSSSSGEESIYVFGGREGIPATVTVRDSDQSFDFPER